MAVNSLARVLPPFEPCSDPHSSIPHIPSAAASPRRAVSDRGGVGSIGSLILRFPPNFVRQLSTKARRNCSNIGVAQVVAASWSNKEEGSWCCPPRGGRVGRLGGAAAVARDAVEPVSEVGDDAVKVAVVGNGAVKGGIEEVEEEEGLGFLKGDGSIAIHGGERVGRALITDAITTPIVNTSAYFFKKTDDLIDFKEKRSQSYEYARYGNYTTSPLEKKISLLEGAESTLFMASGMCASIVMFLALVQCGGHIITTTDCYRKTRIFIENFLLPQMGIKATVIDPADIEGLKSALAENNVTLFFTESPTNPFLRCVDILLVSKLCHKKGALVCIDGTFATPLNQKAHALGADLVLHSATKYISGHNDVLGGCISGSEALVSKIRIMHHILGGTLNPNASYLILRGMKTLKLRVQQQNETASRMAYLLEGHPKVKHVYYPGLPSHPEHELAMRQMSGFGGVVSFEIDGDLNMTKDFVDALKIPYIAPSFGGCESIVDQPAIMSYWDLSLTERLKYGIKDNLVRFSFGLEDYEDLEADVLQALASI